MWGFEVWSSYASSREGQSWCLNSSAIFGAYLYWIVAQIVEYQFLQRVVSWLKS